jgi:HEAT repeat protein
MPYRRLEDIAQLLQRDAVIQMRELGSRLAEVVQQGDDPVPLLIEILLDDDAYVAGMAAEQLAVFVDLRALPALLRTVAYETHQEPYDAHLDEVTQSENWGLAFAVAERDGCEIRDLRSACIAALGHFAHPDAAQALLRIANDPRERADQIREAARRALENMGALAAFDALKQPPS